jgi:hypothetical protein
VSKGKRNRRPSGHPAEVAVRREHEAARRSGPPAGPESVARRIIREANELTSALDAELWASQLLGVFWNQRYTLPLEDAASPDYSLILGEPLIEAVARLGGDGAQTALSAIGIVDDSELGIRAGELAQKMQPEEAAPSWLGDVGEAGITGAAVMREDVFDDASTVFLEARHPSGETQAIGVLIDNNLGRMAKDILLADSIDRVADVMRKHPRGDGELTLEPIAPGVAAGRIYAALELTEMTLDPPVSDDYARLRALAMLRVDEVSHVVPVPERDELPHEERDRLGAVRDGSTDHRQKLLSRRAAKHTDKARRPGRRARPFLDPVTGPRRPTTRRAGRLRGSQSGVGRRRCGASRSRRQHRTSALARAGDHHFAGLKPSVRTLVGRLRKEPAPGRSARVFLDSLPPILPPKAFFALSTIAICREKASTATGIRSQLLRSDIGWFFLQIERFLVRSQPL